MTKTIWKHSIQAGESNMKKVKIITCIYSDLFGTELGGRIGRYYHYRYSLLSLLKMDNSDFLCYTSEREIDDLKEFFYINNNISEQKLTLKVFDIKKTKFQEKIDEKKDIESIKKSDRCLEIQYSKFHWWWEETGEYDYYYWFDAGISHSGLLPIKYLDYDNPNGVKKYFESSLFNNTFLENLINFSENKIFVITKENQKQFWSMTVNPKWYKNFSSKFHVIGGFFGGKKEKWGELVTTFENYLNNIIDEDGILPYEEQILSLMFYNNNELFVDKSFDIWWCRDSAPKETEDTYFEENKSFYKILEELNNIS